MSLFEFTFGQDDEEKSEGKVQGIALAEVSEVLDSLGEGRVRLKLPWLPGVEPWARVAMPSAGLGYGHYFIPHIGDEVVVAFNQGNIAEPVVLGALWSKTARPPALSPLDPIDKRRIRTQRGHEIEFDEQQFKLTITSATQQKIEMTPEKIEVSAGLGNAKITLGTTGEVSVTATTELSLKAPKVSIEGGVVEIKSNGTAQLSAMGITTIKGSFVKIN